MCVLIADARAQQLLDDLKRIEHEDDAGEFRTLVGTPLLLTLLCAVSWVDGRVDYHRRGEFYDRCLRVLLRRRSQGSGSEQPPVTEDQALRMLRAVAHGLHQYERRDQLTIDLFREWALEPMARRSGTGAVVDR